MNDVNTSLASAYTTIAAFKVYPTIYDFTQWADLGYKLIAPANAD